MRIGFIGLGNMGGPMSLNLLRAGHSLTIHDLRRDLAQAQLSGGAQWVESPAVVARRSEVVFTSLPGPKEVEAVALGEGGIRQGLPAGAVMIDLSTNSPSAVRRIGAELAAQGLAMLDAPVSGGTAGARAATLAVYVGGDEAVFARFKPLLQILGDKVMYMGGLGAGSVAKLVHNMISVCTTKIFSEAFTLGVKAGVSGPALTAAVEAGAYGQGRGMLRMMPALLGERDFDQVSFALKLARKDLGLATELGRELNVPMAAANLVEQDLAELMRRGLGEKDRYVQFTLQEERAGIKVQ